MKIWFYMAGLLVLFAAEAQELHAQIAAPEIETKGRLVPPEELRLAPGNSSVDITLPYGEYLQFDSVDVRENAGIKTLRGSSENASFLLTTDGVRKFGYVLRGGKRYVIDTINRSTTIVESSALSRPKYVPDGWGEDFVVDYDLILKQNQRRAVQGETSAQSQALSDIDVAMFYDQSLADNYGLQYPRTLAQAAIDYTNAAIAAHTPDMQLHLVWVGPLSAPLSGDPFSHFNGNADKWTIATDYGADLLHYLYPYSPYHGYCGKAWIPGRTGVSALQCGIDTVAHELGHNFGLSHDRANASDIGTSYSGYNYGYICGSSGTIMAYWSPTLPHYSSPLLQNGGQDCGVAIGEPDAAFNGAVLDITRESTAGYEPKQVALGNVSVVTVNPFQVAEDTAGPILVEIVRDGDLSQETSVEIGTIETGMGAIDGLDFEGFVQRVVFATGESTAQVAINIIDDEKYEADPEEFQVVLRYPYKLQVTGAPLNIQIISEDLDRGVVAFADTGIDIDEAEGTVQIQVERSGSTALEHTVYISLVPTSAIAGVDYTDVSGPLTFGVGESTKTLNVPIIDDDSFDGSTFVNFSAVLTSGDIDYSRNSFSVDIWNDDLYRGQGQFAFDTYHVDENAGSVSIEVERINGNEGKYQFCVNFYSDGTAISGIDYRGGISHCTNIADGETSRSILTNIYDNAVADGEKFFDIEFVYNNGYGIPFELGPRTWARVFINDDEAPTGPTGSIQFGAPIFEGAEGDGMINVPVSRIGGSFGGAVADYSTSQGTATDGVDYANVSGTVMWANGDATDKIVQIPVVDDMEAESVETLQLTLSGISGAAAGSPTATTVIIGESDQPIEPALEYGVQEFVNRLLFPTVIDFEGYTTPGNYLFMGNPGQFTENGVTISNNSQMFVQNNDFYGTDSFLSPQGADPQLVNIALPPETRAVAFFYGAYVPVSGTVVIDGGQQFELPEAAGGVLGVFAIARETPIENIQITVNGPGVDIDNVIYSSSFQFPTMPQPLEAIVAMQDINGNGMPEIGITMPGSTHVQVRDGSTDALISDVDFGVDAALQMLVLPDLDGGGDPEVAMLNEQASGQVRVQIRDSVTGTIVKNLYYGLQYEPVAMDIISDYSGNGFPEIAVLGSEAGTDAVRVQVQDSLTGTFLDNVFLGTQSFARDVVSVADTSGNGIPEIGILGVLKGSGQVRTQMWDAQSSVFQSNIWFGNKYQPHSMITMPDINGNGSDEIVAVGVDPATQNIRVQVRDSDTTATHYNIWLGAVNEAVDIKLINDINSDGFPDLAVLLKTPGGTGRVRVQSGLNGAFIRNLFYSVVQNPVGLAVMPDYNGNGFDELAALGENAGIPHVQILDTSTGSQVNRIDFP